MTAPDRQAQDVVEGREPLSDAALDLLHDSKYIGAYCGYSGKVIKASNELVAAGLGRIGDTDLGPAFFVNADGAALIKSHERAPDSSWFGG